MNNCRRIIILLLLLSVLCPIAFVSAQEFTLGEKTDIFWAKGLTHMYRLEFDKAETQFKQIDASNPARDLALAGLKWWIYSQNFDDPTIDKKSLEKEFTEQAEQTIENCKRQISKEPDNAALHFLAGTAYGLIGRWHGIENNWLRAYKYGKKGKKHLQKAVKLNPYIFDAYAGIGIFDYYSDTLPMLLKKLANLVFIRIKGDKEEGLKKVRLAIDKGKFFSTETKLFLINILLRYEKDYDKAIELSENLRSSDSENPFFHLIEILTLLKARRWQDTVDNAKTFLEKYREAPDNPIYQQLAVIYLSMGDSYLMLNRQSLALDSFNKCVKTEFTNKAWVTLCHLRRGQVFDLLGEREKALADYNEAYNRPDMWESKKYAKKGLKKTYKAEDILQQIQAE